MNGHAEPRIRYSADRPSHLPPRGWWEVAKRVKDQLIADHVQIVSAGVAFYFFLALFPALAAVVSIYGLVVEPAEAERQIDQLAAVLPGQGEETVSEVASMVTTKSSKTLGWGVALSLLISLWSANKGTKAMVDGLNIAYDRDDGRNFIKKTLITLALTLGAILGGIIALALVAGFPALVGMLPFSESVAQAISVLRWPLLAVLVAGFIAILYQVGPDRGHIPWRWITWGSATATLLWLGGSALFSWYVDTFGKWGETYGSFAAVIILMFWFSLTVFSILLGAEINSELEKQTGRRGELENHPAEDPLEA